MNLQYILKNHKERIINFILSLIPLRWLSIMPARFILNYLSKRYWIRLVANPKCPNYHKKYYKDREAEFRVILGIIEERLPCKPKSFFEAGCSVGSNLKAIAKVYEFDKEIKYYGCDINELAIKSARDNNYGSRTYFWVEDVTELWGLKGLPDNNFDVVFTRELFTHIAPGRLKEEIVKELWRICKRCLILIENWDGKDRVLYLNSHMIYYEDMEKYLVKDRLWIMSQKIFDSRMTIVYKIIP